jgi:transcriptional regulator with XRE-family HTH domain
MSKKGGRRSSGFAGRLAVLREARKLTLQQLADKAGCDQATVWGPQHGRSEPAWPLVLRLAAALEVEVTAFLPVEERGRPRKRVQ